MIFFAIRLLFFSSSENGRLLMSLRNGVKAVRESVEWIGVSKFEKKYLPCQLNLIFSDDNTPTMNEVECNVCGQQLGPAGEPEITRHRLTVHPEGLSARYRKSIFPTI